MTTSVAGARFSETVRECVPFVLTLLAFLVTLVFVPTLSTGLPGQLMGR